MRPDFDARREFLARRGEQDPVAWPVPVVLTGFRERLLTPPWLDEDTPEDRRAELQSYAAALEANGIDPLSLTRYGLRDRLERAIMTGVLVADALQRHLDPDAPVLDFISAWSKCLGGLGEYEVYGSISIDPASTPPTPPLDTSPTDTAPSIALETRSRYVNKRTFREIQLWISGASLIDLLTWTPPALREAPSGQPARDDSELHRSYRWLIERMTVTYPAQWSTESLHLEWRWAHGDCEAPTSPGLMNERIIAPEQLDAEIARRAVLDDQRTSGSLTMDQVQEQALKLLARGDRQTAAGLFEAIRAGSPENPEALNNLGFCILPDRPAEAVHHLTLAGALGYGHPAINCVNRMQAHLLVGQQHVALQLADELWARWDRVEPRGRAHLWALSATPELIILDDARTAVAALAAEVERSVDRAGPRVWADRHAELCGAGAEPCRSCQRLIPASV